MTAWAISLAIIGAVFFLTFGKFMTPMRYRIRFPKWDKFLCKIGSHRCYDACGRGCCWACYRCEAEKQGVLDELYRAARKALEERR